MHLTVFAPVFSSYEKLDINSTEKSFVEDIYAPTILLSTNDGCMDISVTKALVISLSRGV